MEGYSPNSTTTADRPFHVLAKPTGAVCNLECAYCYYLEKTDLYPETNEFRMSDETLETFVQQYIDATPAPVVEFAWQGGEPTLLGREFFERAVEFQEKHAGGKRVRNSLQTNGTRLDDDWGEFFRRNEFLVGISIDGPRALHDAYRRGRDGGPTFDAVVDGLAVLQDHGVEYNVLCTVNDVNSRYPLDVYRFFKDRDVDHVQFIPIVEPLDGSEAPDAPSPASGDDAPAGDPIEPPTYRWAEVVNKPDGEQAAADETAVSDAARVADTSAYTVDPAAYGEFLKAVFDEWVRNDVGEISVGIFDQCMRAWGEHGQTSCIFQETCGSSMAVEHSGDLYSCDHFVDSAHRLGNIRERSMADLVDSPEQRAFGERKREGLPEYCESCAYQFMCHGGCPKNRFVQAPDGEAGLNYLCAGYREFFRYVEPYMKLLTKGLERGDSPERMMAKVDALDSEYG
jgi:uncharacterized protein